MGNLTTRADACVLDQCTESLRTIAGDKRKQRRNPLSSPSSDRESRLTTVDRRLMSISNREALADEKEHMNEEEKGTGYSLGIVLINLFVSELSGSDTHCHNFLCALMQNLFWQTDLSRGTNMSSKIVDSILLTVVGRAKKTNISFKII